MQQSDYYAIAKNIYNNYRDVENKALPWDETNTVNNQLSAMRLIIYGLAEMWRNDPNFEYNTFIHICLCGDKENKQ